MAELIKNIEVGGLVKEEYDYISITNSWTGTASSPITIIYRRGGVSGPSITTLTLGYSGDDIVSVSGT